MKTKIETMTETLPADYASAFINGDVTGIESDAEIEHIDSIAEQFAADGWSIVDCGEPYFSNSYHLHFGYQPADSRCLITGGDVADYTLIRAIKN